MMERLHNNRQPLILGIAVLFLVLLAVYILLMRPNTEQIEINDSQITNLQQENDIFQRKIDELQAEGTGTLSEEEIAQKLPADSNKEQVIIDLNRIGDDTGVRLIDASFSDENANTAEASDSNATETVKSLYVTANIQGSYSGIKLWMDQLQNLPRLTAVEQISLQKPYLNSGNTLLSSTVTFKASYLPSAATADPAATDTATETDAAVTPAP